MPWLDLLAKFRGSPPEDKPATDSITNQIIQERLEELSEEEEPAVDPQKVRTRWLPGDPGLAALPESTLAPEPQPADGAITTVLVGIDIGEGEDPAHVLDRMASLEELAAEIFRRGDVTYPAGPAEILLVCPERTPAEVRDAIARLRRQSSPLGTLRVALFSLDGDPRESLPELQAALAVCRASGLELVDKTIIQR